MTAHSPLRFRVAFSTPWFAIEESVSVDNTTAPYYRMTGADGILCLPLTPAGDMVMIRQYRPILGYETLEIPAGAIDGDEPPVEATHREVLEECGHRCGVLFPLGIGRFYLNRCTQREHMMLGLDAEPVANAAIDAGITPLVVPRPDFIEMVRRDEVELSAILSFAGLASAKLGTDLLRDPIDVIRRRVREQLRGT